MGLLIPAAKGTSCCSDRDFVAVECGPVAMDQGYDVNYARIMILESFPLHRLS